MGMGMKPWTFLTRRLIVRQLSSYAAVGGAAAIADYALMIFLREVLAVPVVICALGGYTLGSLVSYCLNRAFTFETNRSHRSASIRFALICAMGFTLTGLLMALFAETLHIPYVIARIQTTALVFLFNFLSHRLWTFRDPRAVKSS